MYTKSLNTCAENLEKFREAQVKESSPNTLKRIAGLAMDSLENAGAKLKLVQQIGEDLIEAINTCTTIKDGEEQAKKVENELDVKGDTFAKFCEEHDKYIRAAKEELRSCAEEHRW